MIRRQNKNIGFGDPSTDLLPTWFAAKINTLISCQHDLLPHWFWPFLGHFGRTMTVSAWFSDLTKLKWLIEGKFLTALTWVGVVSIHWETCISLLIKSKLEMCFEVDKSSLISPPSDAEHVGQFGRIKGPKYSSTSLIGHRNLWNDARIPIQIFLNGASSQPPCVGAEILSCLGRGFSV